MINHFFSVPIYIVAPPVDAAILSEINAAMTTASFKNDWQPGNDTANTTFSVGTDTNIVRTYQMNNIAKLIQSHATEYLKQTKQPYVENSIRIIESWMNTFDDNQQIGWHGHGYQPNTISGVYYHKAPAGCGRLQFKSPNQYNVSFPHHSPDYNSIVSIEPEEGMIVLFPNWILHGTEPNRIDKQRVSFAFNLEFNYNWD